MSGPLSAAFALGPREVITIVGGGGKTTTLFRLGRELHDGSGVSAVVTTTTHIMIPPPEPDLETVLQTDPEAALAACQSVLARGHLPVLGTRFTPEGRLGGVAPEVVDICAAEIPYVVVEADGSAHKPFKAPLAHEPVVPRSTTLLVAIVGVDALGQPLDAEHIHRPERVAELSRAGLGEPVTAETIARVMVHPAGPLRDAPPGARVVILLNKADSQARRAAAEEIASAVRTHGGPPTLIGAVAVADPFPR